MAMDINKRVLLDFVRGLNRHMHVSPILKGGNALVLLYGEDRFSGDLDFDCSGDERNKASFFRALDNICDEYGLLYRVAKNTPTVTRVFVRESEADNVPLKIELSHRSRFLDGVSVNDVRTYSIDGLCQMKCRAYGARDKVRDLQDLAFIVGKYGNKLSDSSYQMLEEVFSYKDPYEQYDYLHEVDASDNLDWEKLGDDVLVMCEKVGYLGDRVQTCSDNSDKNIMPIKTSISSNFGSEPDFELS